MKVFAVTPANIVTGGCELLHQLCFALGLLGTVDPYIVYVDKDTLEVVEADTPEVYLKYGTKSTTDLSDLDSRENVLVLPEQSFGMIESFPNCRKIAWWLAVDTYVIIVNYLKGVPSLTVEPGVDMDYYGMRDRDDIFHLVQSRYAEGFVRDNLSIQENHVAYMTDYLNDIYLEGQVVSNEQKKNIIAFNPAKGFDRIRPLIELTQEVFQWYPIQNMTPDKVRALLNLAKVYIDFGHHPGKDRIPREAAMAGCCVITGKRGAAANDRDVPIPLDYKFDDYNLDYEKLFITIQSIFNDFDNHYARFEPYRQMIRGEKERFVSEVIDVFGKRLAPGGDWV